MPVPCKDRLISLQFCLRFILILLSLLFFKFCKLINNQSSVKTHVVHPTKSQVTYLKQWSQVRHTAFTYWWDWLVFASAALFRLEERNSWLEEKHISLSSTEPSCCSFGTKGGRTGSEWDAQTSVIILMCGTTSGRGSVVWGLKNKSLLTQENPMKGDSQFPEWDNSL